MDTSVKSRTAKVVHGGNPYRAAQGPMYAPGISAETVGSEVIFLGIVTLPPGERTRAHIHEQHESALYMLSGEEVELCSGDALEQRELAQAGDYLFIPPGVAHVAVNRSKTKPAVFIVARNEPTANESVSMLPDLDRNVP